MAHLSRVIVLIDMDCFYCQVEEKLDPSMKGKPIAVVQYNPWRGGGIIAVNYPARDKGVTRHMRGDEARQKCPDIVLARVPQVRGKADISKYREAGNRVAEVLQTFTNLLERASIDEAYLDITEVVETRLNNQSCGLDVSQMLNTFVVGYDTKDFIAMANNHELFENNIKLAIGGLITEEIRAAVLEKTGFKCSAGIAHNKILAKLVCGLHKPNKQTILPHDSVPILYGNLPVTKIKSLGGKFGQTLSEDLNINFMWQLAKFSEKQLSQKFDDRTAHWLYNIARGIDMEPVTLRLISKSIGCCKQFPGRMALTMMKDVEHWTSELASELSERLIKDQEENNRKGKQIVVSFAQNDIHSSRTVPLNSYEHSKIVQCALAVVNKFCQRPYRSYSINFLGMSVGNFQEMNKKSSITNFLMNMSKKTKIDHENSDKIVVADESTNFVSQKYSELNQVACIGEKCTEQDEYFEDDSTNLSIYSATTEEMEIDTEDLIYYDDICPKSVSSESVQCSIVSSQSSEEMENSRKSSMQSFFVKYFENESNETQGDALERQAEDVEDICLGEVKGQSSMLSFSRHENLSEENSVLCNVCDKRIKLEHFGHHMDFHEAKAIAKQGTPVNKTSSLARKTRSKTKVIKRKITEKTQEDTQQLQGERVQNQHSEEVKLPISGQQSVLLFSRSQNLNDENSVLCEVCDKRVKLENFGHHMDFHEAKAASKQDTPADTSAKETRTKSKVITKRKSTEKLKPISWFLLAQESLDETNSEMCLECNKRIKLTHVASHSDFHVAKKIHEEINRMPLSKDSLPPTCKKGSPRPMEKR